MEQREDAGEGQGLKPLAPEFLSWAKQRMKELSEEADQVTRECGLPIEAKWFVASILAEERRVERAKQEASAAAAQRTIGQKEPTGRE